jgi:hypothetical protein
MKTRPAPQHLRATGRRGRYARPEILELKGQTTVEAVPDIRIDWDRILARLV